MSNRKQRSSGLAAIYNLNFYKKQKFWKLSKAMNKEQQKKSKKHENQPTGPLQRSDDTMHRTYPIDSDDKKANVLEDPFAIDDPDTTDSLTSRVSLHSQSFDSVSDWKDLIKEASEMQIERGNDLIVDSSQQDEQTKSDVNEWLDDSWGDDKEKTYSKHPLDCTRDPTNIYADVVPYEQLTETSLQASDFQELQSSSQNLFKIGDNLRGPSHESQMQKYMPNVSDDLQSPEPLAYNNEFYENIVIGGNKDYAPTVGQDAFFNDEPDTTDSFTSQVIIHSQSPEPIYDTQVSVESDSGMQSGLASFLADDSDFIMEDSGYLIEQSAPDVGDLFNKGM